MCTSVIVKRTRRIRISLYKTLDSLAARGDRLDYQARGKKMRKLSNTSYPLDPAGELGKEGRRPIRK